MIVSFAISTSITSSANGVSRKGCGPRIFVGNSKVEIQKCVAFTLVEVLVAVTVFTLILVITFSVLGQVSSVLRNSTAKIEAFQAARNAFNLMTKNLSQATLNTYLAYDDANNPTRYLRRADLRLFCGPTGGSFPGTAGTGQGIFFQLPIDYTAKTTQFGGLTSLLNTCGYFVTFSDDPTRPPHVTNRGKYRYRLMQLLAPTENNKIFMASNATDCDWFASIAGTDAYGSTVLPVADNVIALVVTPEDPAPGATPLAPNYTYNSALDGNEADGSQLRTASQLPPTIQVTMVAIDEPSALRQENGSLEPTGIKSALAGKFLRAADLPQDLKDLEAALVGARIQYRIFSGAVPMRESKWTK